MPKFKVGDIVRFKNSFIPLTDGFYHSTMAGKTFEIFQAWIGGSAPYQYDATMLGPDTVRIGPQSPGRTALGMWILREDDLELDVVHESSLMKALRETL